MLIACLDLEGVLVPEVWINVAQKTGIERLKVTTRDVPDYDALMRQRLSILDEHGLTLSDIQSVISTMKPLDGAFEFLEWLKQHCQVVILSDTYYEFAAPLMKQLNYPALLCHSLRVDASSKIIDYCIRLKDQKRLAVKAFQNLNFKVVAAGDSYNDTAMLSEADLGILFRAPNNVVTEFPQFPVTNTYDELKTEFLKAIQSVCHTR